MTEDQDLQEIEELQQVLREDSSNFQARRRLAVLLLDKGFNDEAYKQFQFLITIYPSDASLYYNLGIVYEKMRDKENAQAAYIKAIELDPEQTDFKYNLGLVYIDMQKYSEAIPYFEEVLETDTDDSNCYFNIGDEDKARSLMLEFIKDNPDEDEPYQCMQNWYMYDSPDINKLAEVIDLAEKNGHILCTDFGYDRLVKYYEIIGDIKNQNKYQELYTKWKNSIETIDF